MVIRLGRVGAALSLAGLLSPLGVTAAAPRKASPPPESRPAPAEPRPAMPPPGDDVKIVVIDDAQARDWELQIELDLLADSVTFPHALRCLAGASGMEVRGYVPNPVVRERALAIARKACPMEVVNSMVLQPNLCYGAPGVVSPDEVRDRLEKVSILSATQVQVQVGPSGQIILTGKAGSLEEKAHFSRCLRGLPGCTAVRNELAAPGGMVKVPTLTAAVPPTANTGDVKTADHKPAVDPRPVPPRPIEQKSPLDQKPSASPKPAEKKSTERAPANPLLPPPGRPLANSRSGKTTSPYGQMPPAPVTPNRQADFRPEAPAVVKDEKPEGVTQAGQRAPAKPAKPSTEKSGPASPLSVRAQQTLKQRVRAMLGPTIKDLDLKFDGARGATVIILVGGKNPDIERIASTLLQLPELQNFDVSLEFRLEQ